MTGSGEGRMGLAAVNGEEEVGIERLLLRPESADWLRWWLEVSRWTTGLSLGLSGGWEVSGGNTTDLPVSIPRLRIIPNTLLEPLL